MAVWWITEAIPLAATALLPVVLFPLLGVMPGKVAAGQYFNSLIFLFLGGFLMALAIERWGLHRRIALRVLLLTGRRPHGVLFGFMASTWFLSMWISNTAASMMMIAIGLAVVIRLEETLPPPGGERLGAGIFLGVAYSASIGGIATLVGTPPNLSLARIHQILFPGEPPIQFTSWLAFAFPLSVGLLLCAWALLAFLFLPASRGQKIDPRVIREEHARLGPPSFAERLVLVDFVLMVVAWVTRADIELGGVTLPGWQRWLPEPSHADDGTVAILFALPLFLLPACDPEAPAARILDWKTARGLPWDVVLLFGGGFALSKGFVESGLSQWLGHELEAAMRALNPPLAVLVASVCAALTALTELTSNTATAEMALPVLASLAKAAAVPPLLLMVAGTLACSCAFMLPVATPPNAIAFGTGRVSMRDMIKAGFWLNLLGVVLVTVVVLILGRPMLGIG